MLLGKYQADEQASPTLILLANPYEPDEKEREKQEKEENQAKDCLEESTNVTETTTCMSSPSRDRPSRTNSIPEWQSLHADARRAGKHLHR
jgi:hypothetical protein